jgi:serine protease AprX
MVAAIFATALSLISFSALRSAADVTATGSGASTASSSDASPIAELAASHPGKHVEVIVQLEPGTDLAQGEALVAAAGGTVEHKLPIINGFGTTLTASEAQRLSWKGGVHAVSLNAPVETEAIDQSRIATAYNQSIRSNKVWNGTGNLSGAMYTGKGVGVAVLDTGIDGTLPDFRVSETDATSRVIASAIINPAATRPGDSFGHGTHIAGLIAGNGNNRAAGDPADGKYIGVAPDANLIDVKIADEQGNASVMDVIDGLQFATDYKADYNIRVVNLSLRSTVAESYKTDPLDAAVEAAWNSGLVVVVAAGNEGAAPDAVSYAPANDPYVITVGGVDDKGTKTIDDDALESWSSRGTTQDGVEKPDVLAPGAHMVSTMSPGAEYTRLCPTCVTDGSYFRVGGTSMAAGVASGEAALLLEADATLTPNEVKAQLVRRARAVESPQPGSDMLVDANGAPVAVDNNQYVVREGAELAADKAVVRDVRRQWNTGLTMNTLLNPTTGQIDYSRASWSRASWSASAEGLRASWSRASWSRASWSRASWSADGMSAPDLSSTDIAQIDAEIAAAKQSCSQLLAQTDPTRASWSRASWSRASWSSSFTK